MKHMKRFLISLCVLILQSLSVDAIQSEEEIDDAYVLGRTVTIIEGTKYLPEHLEEERKALIDPVRDTIGEYRQLSITIRQTRGNRAQKLFRESDDLARKIGSHYITNKTVSHVMKFLDELLKPQLPSQRENLSGQIRVLAKQLMSINNRVEYIDEEYVYFDEKGMVLSDQEMNLCKQVRGLFSQIEELDKQAEEQPANKQFLEEKDRYLLAGCYARVLLRNIGIAEDEQEAARSKARSILFNILEEGNAKHSIMPLRHLLEYFLAQEDPFAIEKFIEYCLEKQLKVVVSQKNNLNVDEDDARLAEVKAEETLLAELKQENADLAKVFEADPDDFWSRFYKFKDRWGTAVNEEEGNVFYTEEDRRFVDTTIRLAAKVAPTVVERILREKVFPEETQAAELAEILGELFGRDAATVSPEKSGASGSDPVSVVAIDPTVVKATSA